MIFVDTITIFIAPPQVAHGIYITILRGLLIPLHGQSRVLFHPDAYTVTTAHIILRIGKALFSRLFIPGISSGTVGRHTDAHLIKTTQLVLRPHISLLGRLRKERQRLYRIGFYTLAFEIQRCQIELRHLLSLGYRFFHPIGSLLIIMR